MFTLRVRMPDGSAGTELPAESWSGSLTERDVIPSSFQVTAPSESLRDFWTQDEWVPDPTRGVFLDDDNGARFSGVLTDVIYQTGETTLTWDSDTLRLWERVAYPNPAQAWGSQTAAYWTHATAAAETIALDLIAAQLGPAAALTYRRNGLIVPASQGRGLSRSIGKGLRFDNIGKWLTDFGEATGLRFTLLHKVGDTVPTVVVRQVVNRTLATPPAVPAIYGSADSGGPGMLADDSWQVRISIPTVTASLGAGSGDLAARLLRERPGTNDPQGWRRVEVYNDQNGIDNAAELDTAGDKALLEGSNPVEITGVSIIDSPGLVLGHDVLLGDLVGADLGRLSLTDRVRVIESTIARGTVAVKATIGSPDAGLTRTQKAYLKQARTRKVAP